MRTEQEMLDLILSTAKEDPRIRAVYMNGSRTNVNAPKDIFQDFDIVYVVAETLSFQQDKTWIDRFGKRLFMQYPDEGLSPSDKNSSYGWLIQFADGNRLDLHVKTLELVLKEIKTDRLCKILLDKDQILPEIDAPTDEDFWVQKPSEMEYLHTCNEFWWCLDNVAKGLWRKEIPYVQDMLNIIIRPELVRMLSFKIGLQTDFSCSIGKSGKYMHRWLSKDEWAQFLKTYAGSDISELWDAVFAMCRLFDFTAQKVGNDLSYDYNREEAENCLAYLHHIRILPQNASEIY